VQAAEDPLLILELKVVALTHPDPLETLKNRTFWGLSFFK
jgi:hypothetical protein